MNDHNQNSLSAIQAAIEQIANSEYKPDFFIANFDGKVKVWYRKKVPQRTYTRNGTIFKTVGGVRRKFGKEMQSKIEVACEAINEIGKSMINNEIKEVLIDLNCCQDIEYKFSKYDIGQTCQNVTDGVYSIRFKFERAKP